MVDHAVAVVVGEVLSPQAVAGCERVLVAVGVVDADEPQLGVVDELRRLLARARALAVVTDEVVEGPPAGFSRQPLARVLHRVVEDCGPAGNVRARCVLRHLEGDDVAPAVRGAGHPLGDDLGMVGKEALVLLRVLLLVVVRDGVVLRPDVPLGIRRASGRVDAGTPPRSAGAVVGEPLRVEL